ncbi:MAG TPA: hypothetical protein VNE39_12280 [Planctomycetota bacterium]|nr:hypothetical protein [Planctomycetota bacterium]
MARRRNWEQRGPDDRIAVNADQAEFAAISYGSCNLEAGMADERIADAMDSYEVADPREVPGWARYDATFDTATSDIGQEVVRRAELLDQSYPFCLVGNRIEYRPSRTLAYEFCLAVSQAPGLSEGILKRLPAAFERLVRDVAICYLGRGSLGYRTGWPPDGLEPRPGRFREVVQHLHELTGEWNWDPQADLPRDPAPRHVKDEGLDFVVWRPMPDRRVGQLFMLGQCACGDDWMKKFRQLDIDSLSRWIRPLSRATPVRVFATPRHIPNEPYFGDVNQAAGLTLDRARIALLAEMADNRDFIVEQAKESYEDLIRLVIHDFEVGKPPCSRSRKGS